MLVAYLSLDHKTRRFVVFGHAEEKSEGIVYVPKAHWDAMGRPERLVVELTPDEECRK